MEASAIPISVQTKDSLTILQELPRISVKLVGMTFKYILLELYTEQEV